MKRTILAVVLGLSATMATAAEPTKAEAETATRRGQLVEDLVTASRLVAFGKGEFGEASEPRQRVRQVGSVRQVRQPHGRAHRVELHR